MDGPQIAAALGLSAGLLLNDFEAQALSLPALEPEWVHPIGAGKPSRSVRGRSLAQARASALVV